jgi:hypothetical protein
MTSSNPSSGEDENPYAPPCADISAEVRGIGRPNAEYQRAFKQAVIPQVIVLVLTALNLDFGRSFRVCAIAALGYWATVAMMMWRRRQSPTRSDLIFLRYGFWFLILLTSIAVPIVWRLTGQV